MSVFGSKFIYDGVSSLDYGLLMCELDSSGVSDESTGLNLEVFFDQIGSSANRADYGAAYAEVLEFPCTVVKEDGSYFSRAESRELLEWISGKRNFRWLKIYDGDNDTLNYLCRATSITKKKVGSDVLGYTIVWTCNSPYAYSDEVTLTETVLAADHECTISNDSDEINDYLYPIVTITPSNACNTLSIENLSDIKFTGDTPRRLEISDVAANETITIDCKNRIITSSNSTRYIGEDFNLNWLRLLPGENNLVLNGVGIFTFRYRLPIKAGDF